MESWDLRDIDGDPPADPMAGRRGRDWNYCLGEDPRGWECTRLRGHTKRHAASDGGGICAVWP